MEKIKGLFILLKITIGIILIPFIIFLILPCILQIVGITYESKSSVVLFCILFYILEEVIEGIVKFILKGSKIEKKEVTSFVTGVIISYGLLIILDAVMDNIAISPIGAVLITLLYVSLMRILDLLSEDNESQS